MAYVPLLQIVGEGLPALDHGAPFVVLDNRPAGALLDIGHDHVGMRLAGTPGLKPAGDATRNQRPARLEFGVPCVVDEDGTLEIDPVILPPLTPDCSWAL
jgi:hypothetical protein